MYRVTVSKGSYVEVWTFGTKYEAAYAMIDRAEIACPYTLTVKVERIAEAPEKPEK